MGGEEGQGGGDANKSLMKEKENGADQVWKGGYIMDDLPPIERDRLLSGHLLSVCSVSQSPEPEEIASK